MRHFFLFLIVAATVLPCAVTAQAYNPKEDIDPNILFRDSERWIRERFRYFYQERADSTGAIPDGVREQAWQRHSLMSVYRPASFLSKTGKAGWTNVGPSNIGGRITGVSIHPTDPKVVYCTAADGGVWYSVDSGENFYPVADYLPTMAMGAIEIDPVEPNNIYVGTGEANGSADSYPGVGVIKSTDGGLNWGMPVVPAAKNIARILVHRTKNNIVLVASRQGLYASTDNGEGWKSLDNGLYHDLVQHPTDPSIIFACKQSSGILKSTDDGTTWRTLNIGVPADSIGRIMMDISRSDPNVMYAVIVAGKGTARLKSIVRSSDGGSSWTRLETATTPNFFSTYGWYNIIIAVDPSNPDRVLAGGVGLYYSNNGGARWNALSGVHVDQHAIEFSQSNPSICYLGNDGGMYRSTNAGVIWSNLNDNLPITQFYELGIALQDPDMMMGGTQDNGSKRRGGPTANWLQATGGDGAYCIIDYKNSNYLYTEYQNGSHQRSTNGGSTWAGINDGLFGSGLWVTPVAIHPVDPKILFTATTKQLYKTINRGSEWFPFHGNMDSSASVNYIAISRANPDLMLCGFTNGRIWKSTDAGVTWEIKSTGLPNRICKDIIFDPVDPDTYYACYTGYAATGIYKSTDGGDTWVNITGNLPGLPKNALEINPSDPKNIFVGTDFGVYATTDGGTTWDILGDGMPLVVIADLELHPTTGTLFAATHGRSVYALSVTTPVEFTGLSASLDGAAVRLSWQTTVEVNNRGFGIERSVQPGGSWEEIGFVEGRGTTPSVNFYEFLDAILPPDAHSVAYRLRMVSSDGAEKYSPEVLVKLGSTSPVAFTLSQNYPNPFNPVTSIRYSIPEKSEVRLVVTDMLGREITELVNKTQYAGAYSVQFDARDVPGGSYFYHLHADGARLTKKMVVLK